MENTHNFYTDVLKKNKNFTSLNVIKDINLLEPGTRAAVTKLIALAKQAGHDLHVGETFRSQARQQEVYAKGASRLKKVGTHGYGLAADLILFPDSTHVDYDDKHYLFLQELSKQVGLISGIDWGLPQQPHDFRDFGHVQRIPLFRQPEVFAGEWYPPIDYDPYEDMRQHHIG